VILLEAQRKFPLQTQTLELCKHVTSEMTPLFCQAVKVGKMKADEVLRDGFGGMQDLLHSLLIRNDDGPPTGSGLSDKAFRLGQKVKLSDEWLALAKAIAGVQHNSDLRTGEKQAESPRSQNSANSAQSTLSGKQRSKRLRATVNSPIAARKMEKYLESRCIGLTDFAATVSTTDRTLRSFRKTGKVRRDIFESIAKHMGTTKEALLTE
jgi:hypothetical protein